MRELPGFDDVHIWTFQTSVFSPVEAGVTALLHAGERERAMSFRFDSDRRSFESTRAALRIVLANYLGDDPKELQLEVNEHGKPYLPAGPHFNVSHSSEHAVIAVSCSPVGVDVENIRSGISGQEIARMFFSSKEIAWLEGRPAENRRKDFFRIWVIKEAFVKCVGAGLSIPLSECELEFDGSEVQSIHWHGHEDRKFIVSELNIWDGFASALVLSCPQK